MATMIFVDQENGDVASTLLSKDHLKLLNTIKPVLKGNQGKMFSNWRPVEKTSRKALGNINKQVINQKVVPSQTGGFKVMKPVQMAKKVSEARVKPSKQSYPEIEKCIPYNPRDFEIFDVPEEHKLSHLCLAGVPLMVNEIEAKRFDTLLNQEPAPMELPSFSWELDAAAAGLPSFLTTLDEITLDLPPMLHCW